MSEPVLGGATLDHVGIAVHFPDHPLLRALGGLTGNVSSMPSGVNVSRFGPAAALELVWPASKGSPVERFLAGRGPGLHHLALALSEPLAAAVTRLADAGLATTGPIEPSSDGRPSAFIHPASAGGVLVELVQADDPAVDA
jgi:LAO/AO transport system kinase